MICRKRKLDKICGRNKEDNHRWRQYSSYDT